MQVGDEVFLRRPLHPLQGGQLFLPRCSRGYVVGIVAEGSPRVQVTFLTPAGRVKVTCYPQWLEAGPGTMTRAMEGMARPYDWYRVGMMISDLRFPEPTSPAGVRFVANRARCMAGMQGTSFYPRIDALRSKLSFDELYGKSSAYLEKIGLVLCMAPHPWWNQTRFRTTADFHQAICLELMTTWDCRCIVLLRTEEAERVYERMRRFRRVRIMPTRQVHMHYIPLMMYHNNGAMIPVNADRGWAAIVIEPALGSEALQRLHIPTEILQTMLRQKVTLELAAFTCESAVASLDWVREQRELHAV